MENILLTPLDEEEETTVRASTNAGHKTNGNNDITIGSGGGRGNYGGSNSRYQGDNERPESFPYVVDDEDLEKGFDSDIGGQKKKKKEKKAKKEKRKEKKYTNNQSTGGNGGGKTGKGGGKGEDEETTTTNKPMFAQQESKWVVWSKVTFLLILAIVAGLSSFFVYIAQVERDVESMKTRFTDFANQIISVSQLNAKHIFQIYEGVSRQISIGIHPEDWPFVTIDGYEPLMLQTIEQTGANFVGLTPLVVDQDRQAYEQYAYENQDWISIGLALTTTGTGGNHDSMYETLNRTIHYAETNKEIHCLEPDLLENESDEMPHNEFEETETCPKTELYAPVRHVAPIQYTYEQLNYDAFSFPFFKRVYAAMVDTSEAVLSEVLNLDINVFQSSGSHWPTSFMAAPVYDKPTNPNEARDRNMVGILTAELPWHSYFENLLPNTDLFIVYLVVRSTCNQEFSYLINGPNVTYLGPEDIHETRFDEYEVSADFDAVKTIEECKYSFHLFPGDEFVDKYETSEPLENAIAIGVVFAICAIAFTVYDCLVERRKNTLLTAATKTGLLVNSLFPENVRDRLLEDALHAALTKEKEDKNRKKSSASPSIVRDGEAATANETTTSPSTNISIMKSPRSTSRPTISTDTIMNENTNSGDVFFYKTNPIADLFPNATVLFSDLVGFTAWSSNREPTQVFILLETLYNNFDIIADKLDVFKVETIGDCYVAATGLPKAQPDHAVLMTKFARKCLVKLKGLVHQLEVELGPGTSDLTMRFGLHSGPVTAGVLRGAKSRFQLFGDTVNTAARMESNGLKDRIHVSQQTADQLILAGKSSWVTPREDKISAKGKGVLQTYWVSTKLPPSYGGSLSNSSGGELRESSASSISTHEVDDTPRVATQHRSSIRKSKLPPSSEKKY